MIYLNSTQKRLLRYYLKDIAMLIAVDDWNAAKAVLDAARDDEDLPKAAHQFIYAVFDGYEAAKGYYSTF